MGSVGFLSAMASLGEVDMAYRGVFTKLPDVPEPFKIFHEHPPLELKDFLSKVGMPAEGKEQQYLSEIGWVVGKSGGRPEFHLYIPSHDKDDYGHTWYNLQCHLCADDFEHRHWQVGRRLVHMRSLLHDPIKSGLGDAYPRYFEATPFASHTAPPGTTARLAEWFNTLCRLMNEGILSTRFTALVVAFFSPLPPRPYQPPADAPAVPIQRSRNRADSKLERPFVIKTASGGEACVSSSMDTSDELGVAMGHGNYDEEDEPYSLLPTTSQSNLLGMAECGSEGEDKIVAPPPAMGGISLF